MALFVYWGHEGALFFLLRGQQIEELGFLGRRDFKLCLYLLELCLEVLNLVFQ